MIGSGQEIGWRLEVSDHVARAEQSSFEGELRVRGATSGAEPPVQSLTPLTASLSF